MEITTYPSRDLQFTHIVCFLELCEKPMEILTYPSGDLKFTSIILFVFAELYERPMAIFIRHPSGGLQFTCKILNVFCFVFAKLCEKPREI